MDFLGSAGLYFAGRPGHPNGRLQRRQWLTRLGTEFGLQAMFLPAVRAAPRLLQLQQLPAALAAEFSTGQVNQAAGGAVFVDHVTGSRGEISR